MQQGASWLKQICVAHSENSELGVLLACVQAPFVLRFWSKWIPRRIKHNAFVLGLWTCVWLLGTYPLGRPLTEGWRFMFTVSFFARIGYSAAWMFITNFTHSLPWNEFLAQDPGRTWPVLHNVMAMVLGGKHRWNEMLFHDAARLYF